MTSGLFHGGRLFLLALLLLHGLSCAGTGPGPVAAAGEGPSPPVSTAHAFFRDPDFAHLALSPDGQRIAGIGRREGGFVLFDMDVREGTLRALTDSDATDRRVRAVGWSGPSTIVASIERFFASRPSGAWRTESFAVRLDDRRPVLGSVWGSTVVAGRGEAIVHWLPDDDEHVLVRRWDPSRWGARVRRVRVSNGVGSEVVAARAGISRWFADREGNVRAGSGPGPQGIQRLVLVRPDGDGPFSDLTEGDRIQHSFLEFAGFHPDPNLLYVRSSSESGHDALYLLDLATREETLVYAHDRVDVGRLYQDPRDGTLEAVELETDLARLHFFDAEAALEQAAIDTALPGTSNRVHSSDLEGTALLIESSADTSPPRYHLFHPSLPKQEQMQFLGASRPELTPEQLAPTRAVHFSARDGLEIHGYLTLPRGKEPRDLPTIVLPHDGPTRRDRWGWSPVVQFLSSRGFAVFQPNFRGSSGYGQEFERMGLRQWGLAIQDDIEDGVHFLIGVGIIDSRRVGIYGVGFGGYAALMGAVKTPRLYRAVASFGAPTDLTALRDHPKQYRSLDPNPPVFSSLPADLERLAATSPALHAQRVVAPVLLAHGKEDPIVHIEQGRIMARALAAAGVEVEKVFYRGEPHELLDERNRIDFHERLASFFERHLAAASPHGQGVR